MCAKHSAKGCHLGQVARLVAWSIRGTVTVISTTTDVDVLVWMWLKFWELQRTLIRIRELWLWQPDNEIRIRISLQCIDMRWSFNWTMHHNPEVTGYQWKKNIQHSSFFNPKTQPRAVLVHLCFTKKRKTHHIIKTIAILTYSGIGFVVFTPFLLFCMHGDSTVESKPWFCCSSLTTLNVVFCFYKLVALSYIHKNICSICLFVDSKRGFPPSQVIHSPQPLSPVKPTLWQQIKVPDCSGWRAGA